MSDLNLEDGILFNPSDVSARLNYRWEIILRKRNEIIESCDKCENGFISQDKKISKIEDLTYGSEKECSCRKRAKKIEKYITSNILEKYWRHPKQKIPIDKKSSTDIKIYLDKIDEAFKNGIGVMFLGRDKEDYAKNFPEGKTLCSIKILMTVIEKGYSAHIETLHGFFDMKKNAFDRPHFKKIVEEIEEVDFLCIDGIGRGQKTDWAETDFNNLLLRRMQSLKPTILITDLCEQDAKKYFGESFYNDLAIKSLKITLTKFDNGTNGKTVYAKI